MKGKLFHIAITAVCTIMTVVFAFPVQAAHPPHTMVPNGNPQASHYPGSGHYVTAKCSYTGCTYTGGMYVSIAGCGQCPHTHVMVQNGTPQASHYPGSGHYVPTKCSVSGCTQTGSTYVTGQTGCCECVGHSWNSGTVTKTPTCSNTGTKTYTCTKNSSHTKVETLSKDPNNHSWQAGTAIAATCSKTGTRPYTCLIDTSHTKTETIPINPNNHDGGCSVCNPPHTHSYTAGSYNQTNHPHYKVNKCACGAEQVTTTTSTSSTCSTCNPPHTHTESSAWSTDDTYHWKTCTGSGCNVKIGYTVHSYGTAVPNVYDPSHTNLHKQQKQCLCGKLSYCGSSYSGPYPGCCECGLHTYYDPVYSAECPHLGTKSCKNCTNSVSVGNKPGGCPLCSTEFTINVTVKRKIDGTNLSNATVYYSTSSGLTQTGGISTNANGVASLTGLDRSVTYGINVEAPGYCGKSHPTDISYTSSSTVSITVELELSSPYLGFGWSDMFDGMGTPSNPTFKLSSPYGWRYWGGLDEHQGIDVMRTDGTNISGTPIKSVCSGTVANVFTNNSSAGYGIVVKYVSATNGDFFARYMHMNGLPTKSDGTSWVKDTPVSAGELLGYAGGSGNGIPNAYTPHLHLDVGNNVQSSLNLTNTIDPRSFYASGTLMPY